MTVAVANCSSLLDSYSKFVSSSSKKPKQQAPLPLSRTSRCLDVVDSVVAVEADVAVVAVVLQAEVAVASAAVVVVAEELQADVVVAEAAVAVAVLA